jgi:hypothetical protein
MASLPLIQPSLKATADGSRATKQSIFSNPTEDIYSDMDLDLDKDGNEGDSVSWVHLDPSPIGKDTTVEKWSQSNRTLQSTFRPSTNELAVYVAGKKAAEQVRPRSAFLYFTSTPSPNVRPLTILSGPPIVPCQTNRLLKGQHRLFVPGNHS